MSDITVCTGAPLCHLYPTYIWDLSWHAADDNRIVDASAWDQAVLICRMAEDYSKQNSLQVCVTCTDRSPHLQSCSCDRQNYYTYLESVSSCCTFSRMSNSSLGKDTSPNWLLPLFWGCLEYNSTLVAFTKVCSVSVQGIVKLVGYNHHIILMPFGLWNGIELLQTEVLPAVKDRVLLQAKIVEDIALDSLAEHLSNYVLIWDLQPHIQEDCMIRLQHSNTIQFPGAWDKQPVHSHPKRWYLEESGLSSVEKQTWALW